MTDQIEQDQAAANDELSPAERLLLMEGQHRSLDQKIIELQSRPLAKPAIGAAPEERKAAAKRGHRTIKRGDDS